MCRVVGGEFELDPNMMKAVHRLSHFEGFVQFSTGRGALYGILRNIEINFPSIDCILLPDYLCDTIVRIVEQAGFRVAFYHITDFLVPDESLEMYLSNKVAVLLINYFGIVNTESIVVNIKNSFPDIPVVLDQVQDLDGFLNRNSDADYCFTSLRKWLGVPDGAFVKTKFLFKNDLLENKFAQLKFVGQILKNYRDLSCITDDTYLRLFEESEDILKNNFYSKISEFTSMIVKNIDFDKMFEDRKKNGTYLRNRICNVLDVQECDVRGQMFIPIFVKDNKILRNFLFSKNIFCPIHWINSLGLRQKLYDKELSLIIDQRYSENEMDRLADCIEEFYK